MADLIQAGDFATEGEKRAAEELRKLPAGWVIIANKILPASQGRSFEIDFIVIGEHLVFVIDEKSWLGRIHGSDQIWVRQDGSSERSPLAKSDYVARIVAGRLRDGVPFRPPITTHFVEGRVLLSRAEERPSLRDPRASEGVLMLRDAVTQLTKSDASAGDPQIQVQREAITRVLYDLSDRPKVPKAIDLYRIDEGTPAPYGSYVYRATHPEAGPRTLSVYKIAGADADAREFYLREFRALKRLRRTGVVPEVMDSFSWSDDYLVVPTDLPDGVSLKAEPRTTGARGGLRELQIASAAFRALALVHAEGIIHRALGPESVYVRDGEAPSIMFTGFFAAREGGHTIAPKLDELHIADPYAAPEIALGYEFAETGSDSYALALIFLERLSGVPVARLVQTEGNLQRVEVPTADADWPSLPTDVLSGLIAFFNEALSEGSMAPVGSAGAARLSATQCAERLAALSRQASKEEESVKGQLLDRRYTILRLLGTGSSAQTFLVTDNEAEGLFVIKQFLRPEMLRESGEAKREFTALRKLDSKYLPRVYDIYPSSEDAHVKMEYVEGVTLAEALHTYQGQPDRWRRLAEDLLGAVAVLEHDHLLHRDIKPANVILRDGNETAVLIDFGLAAPAGGAVAPAGTPRYLPPEAYTADQPPPSIDRYALGVLLFDALFGYSPFVADGERSGHMRLVTPDSVPDGLRSIAAVLLRAIDPDPGERYGSAAEFTGALSAAMGMAEPDPISTGQRLDALINPWVDQVRGLFRNSRRGNADNRGMDSPFAHDTYVETALDTWLWPAILRDRPRVVFLSGNPGDGKTAFLERVREQLKNEGGQQISRDGSGWVWELDGHAFRACYDASESHQGRSADEQLRERFRDLEGVSPTRATLTVLIAINDGRLADVLHKFREGFPWLVQATEAAQRANAARDPRGIWLIDLKRRAYVTPPDAATPSVLRRMLARFTDRAAWEVCTGCIAQHECPIRTNALALDAQGDEAPVDRLERALLLAHLRGTRHFTVRDVRSGLAYLLTGDLSCKEVHEARTAGTGLDAEYWRIAFTTDGDTDIMLGDLRALDPGRFAQPRLERFLFFKQESDQASERARLYANQRDLPPLIDTTTWLERNKQRLYFESAPIAEVLDPLPCIAWQALLPYRYAERFLSALSGDGKQDAILAQLIRGIGRSDGIRGPVLASGLCLKVAHSDSQHMTVIKRFSLESFSLSTERIAGSAGIEVIPSTLMLRHQESYTRLIITLDLFEILMRLADGLEPGSPELVALLEDLTPFKSTLQLLDSNDLILIEGGRRMQQLTQREGTIICEPLQVGAIG